MNIQILTPTEQFLLGGIIGIAVTSCLIVILPLAVEGMMDFIGVIIEWWENRNPRKS